MQYKGEGREQMKHKTTMKEAKQNGSLSKMKCKQSGWVGKKIKTRKWVWGGGVSPQVPMTSTLGP